MRPLLGVPGLDGVHSATWVVFARPRVPQAVGAENPVMSCDLDVLVGDAAELVSSERPSSCSAA
jgi:hypothetical protein